jgi:hypothetical protein
MGRISTELFSRAWRILRSRSSTLSNFKKILTELTIPYYFSREASQGESVGYINTHKVAYAILSLQSFNLPN